MGFPPDDRRPSNYHRTTQEDWENATAIICGVIGLLLAGLVGDFAATIISAKGALALICLLCLLPAFTLLLYFFIGSPLLNRFLEKHPWEK